MATANILNKRDDILFGPNSLPVKVTGMQGMASKMWVPFLGMGFMIVVAAFIVGLVNSGVAADYFTASKLTREAAGVGTTLATQKAFIESTKIWLHEGSAVSVGQ